ncbi:MAG: iron-sulfur cluster assembly scaffold protein [Proteobacteria bacterium]|jgi:nitrogen fixation protein NifU and related proteins|nr:iron-sulfur cluster assembly scaffold protein [Pseudomonadota bacterium]
MIDQLYQKTILKHAANAVAHGAMQNAHHHVMVHNPMCGDRIKVYVKLAIDQVTHFSHETKACALCQASASILGEHYHGLTCDNLTELIKQLKLSLSDESVNTDIRWPDKKWESLNVFSVVRDHKSRKNCVLLPFNALLQALEEMNLRTHI